MLHLDLIPRDALRFLYPAVILPQVHTHCVTMDFGLDGIHYLASWAPISVKINGSAQ